YSHLIVVCISYLFVFSFFLFYYFFFFFSSRRRHTRWPRDWSSDVCSSDLDQHELPRPSGGVDGAAGVSEGGEHGQPCAPAPGDESGHGSKDTRPAVRELPLRPPTGYGAAHETAPAEGHPGHRASRSSRRAGARRRAHSCR